ncbi:MAG: ankyrin repeat domain-containing protein, partial [Deltaproteobacteria bacterium]|nr:ankyrin repeat domain-containing protein [Deltaproteobacteria bacterium]
MAKTPSLQDQLLHAAGGRGTDDDLRALIARGADVKGRAGAGPLNWAVNSGRLSTVQLLLDAGASIDGDHPEHTPLMQAKRAEVARYLLERGARTDGREALRGDALDFTIDRADDTEHARVLLDHGFRVEPRHLISATKKRRTGIVKLLLDRGGDIEGIDRDGSSLPRDRARVPRERHGAATPRARRARVARRPDHRLRATRRTRRRPRARQDDR